jgi:hypothetical protein
MDRMDNIEKLPFVYTPVLYAEKKTDQLISVQNLQMAPKVNKNISRNFQTEKYQLTICEHCLLYLRLFTEPAFIILISLT